MNTSTHTAELTSIRGIHYNLLVNNVSHAITIEPIGSVPKEHGKDQYMLVSTEDLDQGFVERAFLDLSYRDTDIPGGYYCHNVDVYPAKNYHQYVVVIYHRHNDKEAA